MPSSGELICMIRADTRLVCMQISMKYGSAGKTKSIRPTLFLFLPTSPHQPPKVFFFCGHTKHAKGTTPCQVSRWLPTSYKGALGVHLTSNYRLKMCKTICPFENHRTVVSVWLTAQEFRSRETDYFSCLAVANRE